MSLISVFFPYEDTFARVIIDADKVDHFIEMGAFRTPGEAEYAAKSDHEEEIGVSDELNEPSESTMQDWVQEVAAKPAPNIEGDKGFGRPGTVFFHELEINGMNDFESIRDYVYDVTGRKMRKKDHDDIDIYRQTAMKLVKGFANDG